jgi:hypothetical protein
MDAALLATGAVALALGAALVAVSLGYELPTELLGSLAGALTALVGWTVKRRPKHADIELCATCNLRLAQTKTKTRKERDPTP